MKRIICFIMICIFFQCRPARAVIVYQDYEDNNGTPHKQGIMSLPVEYGWGFNGAVVQRSGRNNPVHGGSYSWAVTIPAGPRIKAGTAVVSQTQGFYVNFVPQCHDRLMFWIWSDPSEKGDHTVMVKFFDQGRYKDRGAGIWTRENQRAQYRQWTKLEIDFNRLPDDFDLEQVEKIEFFNYWDGTYYYDDIQIVSAFSREHDLRCLADYNFAVCQTGTEQTVKQECVSVFGERAEEVLDLLQTRAGAKLRSVPPAE